MKALIMMLMYFNMTADITVGDYVFKHIKSCEINQSIRELSDNATITLPRRLYLKDNEVSIVDYIKEGDEVDIKLGYDDNNYDEFKGYVREITADNPLQIICDDEMYKLKQGNFIESWESVTLKQLLNTIAPDYTIDCPDVNLGKFEISSASPYIVLQELKRQYGLHTILRDGVLYVGFVGDVKERVPVTHIYDLTKNVKKNNLKYQRKESVNLKIKAISNLPNGKKLKVTVGSTDPHAAIRTLNFGEKTEAELRKLATEALDTLRFDGYSGNIIGFGFDRTMAGDAIKIIDTKEKDREGTYFIESLKIRFGKTFFERINTLSYKLS
jgi:hypothetical protein